MQNEPEQQRIKDFGLKPDQVALLTERAAKEVNEGLLPASQFALAKNGKIVVQGSFGAANNESLIAIFSCTKAIASTAAWLLIESEALDVSVPVCELIPEFAENGKEKVTVEQLFTHTAGFPSAPMSPVEGTDPARRSDRFRRWRLNWPAGERFEYHASSSMYVIADIIERLSGQRWQDFARTRILEPLGIADDVLLGVPEDAQARVLQIEFVGQALTEADYRAANMPAPPVTEVTEEAITAFNLPAVRAAGMPGGGAFATASAMALFYQALLRDGGLAPEDQSETARIWQQQTILDGLRIRSGDLKDPLFGRLVNRALGLVISGDEGRPYRGFGYTNSPDAFGHGGAGGQVAWADPANGLSFAYATSGHDRNTLRRGRREVSVSNAAGRCG